MGTKKYILIVENIQYRGDVSWNVPVWSCSLSRARSKTDISNGCLSLLKA